MATPDSVFLLINPLFDKKNMFVGCIPASEPSFRASNVSVPNLESKTWMNDTEL